MKWLISRQLQPPSFTPSVQACALKVWDVSPLWEAQHLHSYFQSVLSIGVCGGYLVWFLCCAEEYEHAQIQEWKVGCLVLNLPPFGLNRCKAYFCIMALLQMGVPVGPVSWLHVERLLRTDTLTKYNNARQNNYTTCPTCSLKSTWN